MAALRGGDVVLFHCFSTLCTECELLGANKVYVAPGQQGQARVLLNNWEKRREVKRVSYTLTIGGVTGEEHVLELEKPLTYNDAATLTVDVPPAAHPGSMISW